MAISAQLSNRRTRQTVYQLQDNKLNLAAGQTQQRQGTWTAQGQSGDLIDAVLTAQWLGHDIELSRSTAQLSPRNSPCRAGEALATSRFSPMGANQGLFAQGGGGSASSHADWQWALGADTRQRGRYESDRADWVAGKTYTWRLDIDRYGKGQFTVKDGGRTVASESYSSSAAKLKLGNALRVRVQSAADVGTARISASLTRLQGQSVNLSLATQAAGQDQQSAIYQPTLGQGLSAEGNVRLDYTGNKPPQGTRMQFSVQPGNAQCQ